MIRKPHAFLLLMVLLAIPLFFYGWVQPVFEASDDLAYISLANDINQGTFKLVKHSFPHRFATILPTALSFKLFGIHLHSATLWPLICSLILIATVYGVGVSLFGMTAGFLGAFLLAVNPLHIKYSLVLNTDVVLSLFFFLSAVFLFWGRQSSLLSQQKWLGLGFVLAFTCGILAKMSMIWMIPLILYCMGEDALQRKNGSFWRVVIIGGGLSGFFYFFAYYVYTGDFLYRLSSIEQLMDMDNHVGNPVMERVYTYEGSFSSYVPRLTREPLMFLLKIPGFILAFALALPIFIHSVRRFSTLPVGTGYWAVVPLIFLFFLWFGSVSLSHYTPMALQENYLVPMLPTLSLLGGVLLARLFDLKVIHDSLNRYLLIGTLLLLVGLIVLLKVLVLFKLQIMLAVVPFVVLLMVRWILPKTGLLGAWGPWMVTGVLLISLLFIPLVFHDNGRLGGRPYQWVERDIALDYLAQESRAITVVSDRRSLKTLPFFLGFPKNRSIQWVDWDSLTREGMVHAEGKIFVLIHRARLKALRTSYGLKMPDFVNNPPSSWLHRVSKEGVSLYEVDQGMFAK